MKRISTFFAAVLLTVFAFAQDAAEKLNQASEALKAKDYAKAFALYDDAMKNLGEVQIDQKVNYNIGIAATKIGNMEAAEAYFAKAIEAGVKAIDCQEQLAAGYSEKKDYPKAVAAFEKAVTLAESKDDSNGYIYKAGTLAYNGGLTDKAIELFNKSIENGYKGETALFYKAAILKKQGKTAEYKATLEEGALKFPGDAKISPALANIYVVEGNEIYKKGATILTAANQKVTANKLKTTDAAYTAELEKAKTEFKNAIVVLEKAKALDPANANAQKLLDGCNAALK